MPRLARGIAHFSVPTPTASSLMLVGCSGDDSDVPALAGLVARSHGAHVRAFFGVLDERFNLREFRGVHAVFLMALLRVADYLQVDAERAPAQSLRVRRLASPISTGEWQAHHAVKDIRQTHDDPAAIFIDAHPPDVRTFLKIQGWFTGIQQGLPTRRFHRSHAPEADVVARGVRVALAPAADEVARAVLIRAEE